MSLGLPYSAQPETQLVAAYQTETSPSESSWGAAVAAVPAFDGTFPSVIAPGYLVASGFIRKTGTSTLEAIATRCGFESARQLRRVWKDAFGTSPSAGR